jgi:hypothetical protein
MHRFKSWYTPEFQWKDIKKYKQYLSPTSAIFVRAKIGLYIEAMNSSCIYLVIPVVMVMIRGVSTTCML